MSDHNELLAKIEAEHSRNVAWQIQWDALQLELEAARHANKFAANAALVLQDRLEAAESRLREIEAATIAILQGYSDSYERMGAEAQVATASVTYDFKYNIIPAIRALAPDRTEEPT